MYLIPLVRANRAISSALIFSNHPITAIATSEIISVFLPLLNSKMYVKIVAYTIAIMYNPTFAKLYLYEYQKNQQIYYQAEICSSLLFILTLLLNY